MMMHELTDFKSINTSCNIDSILLFSKGAKIILRNSSAVE